MWATSMGHAAQFGLANQNVPQPQCALHITPYSCGGHLPDELGVSGQKKPQEACTHTSQGRDARHWLHIAAAQEGFHLVSQRKRSSRTCAEHLPEECLKARGLQGRQLSR